MRNIEKRPSLAELEEKGIVPPSWAIAPGVNPALADRVLKREKQRKADAVESALKKRPSLDEARRLCPTEPKRPCRSLLASTPAV